MLDTSNTQMLSYLGNEVVFEHVKLLCHHTDNGSKSRTKSLLSSMFRRSSETQRKKRDAVYARGLNVINGGCHGNLTEPLLNLKSKETANILKAALQSLIFAASHDELDKTLFAMKRLDVAPNEVIITQGDVGDKFYVVQSGVLEVSVNGSAVGKLLTGDHFGELALIYDAPRAATIVATTPAVLWTLDRDEFRMIQAQSSNDTLLQRATWLRQVDLLASLSERQLALLAGLLKAVKFEDEDCIVRQGDVGENFYIIEEGEAVCRALGSPLAAQSGETEVARFGPGDYFGELALLSDMPRNASVYAQGLVKCLSLDRQAFVSMLGPLAEVLEHNSRLRILKATPELAYLSLDDLEYLVSQLEFETYDNNECVYREGDDADAFYIIKSGSVQLVTVCEDPVTGQLIPRGVLLGASDVFGIEMLQQYHGAYKHTAVASGGAQILCLPATALKLLEKALYADDEMDAQQVTSKYGRIAFEDIQQGPIIAEGSFARVHIAHVPVEDEPVPQPMALKVMSKAHIVKLRVQGHVMCEKEALSVLPSHPSIIELYGTYQDQDNLYMLLEFVPGGELLNLLDNDELLTEDAARFYAANALLGLQHMHAHDIMYRDLKPENLLLGKDGYLKFVDFGFAKRLPFVSVDEDGTEHLQTRTYTLCGTPDYLAPEHILCRGHDQAVDYWTLGVLIYEMLVGYTPFSNAEDDKTEMYRKIARVGTGEDRVRFPSHMIQSPDAKDLIRRLLQGDPSNRLGFGINGAKEIREHPWFSSIDWDALLLKQIPPPYVPELKADDDVSRFMGQSGDRVWDLPFDGVGDEFFVGF